MVPSACATSPYFEVLVCSLDLRAHDWLLVQASHLEFGQATWDHSTLDHTTAMLAWSRCVRMNAHELT